MTQILGISGRKQSGKTTSARLVFGFGLEALGFTVKMDDNGNLLVQNDTGEFEILDPQDRRPEAHAWFQKEVWPYIKVYSWADPLKEMAINILGLTEEQCYGSDEDKNTLTDVKWEKLPISTDKTGFMTAREVLQIFGTEIYRKIDPNIWVKATLRKIAVDQPKYAIIADTRFPNEARAILQKKGHVINLRRKVSDDNHPSETALDDFDHFSAEIDNTEVDIHEKNANLYIALMEIGWVPKEEGENNG